VRCGRDGARRFLRGGTARRFLQRHSVEKMLECGAVRWSMAEAASSSSTSCIVSVLGKEKIEGEKRIGEGKLTGRIQILNFFINLLIFERR
jgi:hypothetical protein